METATQTAPDRCHRLHFPVQQRVYSPCMQGPEQPLPVSTVVSYETWTLLIKALRADIAEAVETTLERTHTMHSYDAVTMDARRELVSRSAGWLDG